MNGVSDEPLLSSSACLYFMDDACAQQCDQQPNQTHNQPQTQQYTKADFVYVEYSNGKDGFIMKRDVAQRIITLIENRYGFDKLHDIKHYDHVCRILHKRCEKDIAHSEWKTMGKDKPRHATW